MIDNKEYQRLKRNFILEKDINNNNVYDYFEKAQVNLLKSYYEWYTKLLFSRLRGSLRLEVSPLKVKKLVALKGEGDWEFAGMVDAQSRGAAVCELGHPIRYVYYAQNIKNGQLLRFGSRCVGDFFNIDEDGVKALTKVKDLMLTEMKEIASIKTQKLIHEHYIYDCGPLGLIIENLGVDSLKNLASINPLIGVAHKFLSLGMPLPISLIEELKENNAALLNVLEDFSYYEVDMEELKKLQESDISLISKMFLVSEAEIQNSIKKNNKNKQSDFYIFRTIPDLKVGISVWKGRSVLVNQVHDFFKDKGVNCEWVDLYKYAVQIGYKRDNKRFYQGLLLMTLFDKNIKITESGLSKNPFSYKGYQLTEEIQDDFDYILEHMSTREFIMAFLSLLEQKTAEDKDTADERERKALMMVYLKEHLPLSKYDNIQGIKGVKDIVLVKKIDFQRMSDKQLNYVEDVYKRMLALDNKDIHKPAENNSLVFDADINNSYSLSERPDILAKIQRLQNECLDKLNAERPKTVSIMTNILNRRRVSDKQIKNINEAFSIYILGEVPKEEEVNVPLDVMKPTNRKWYLTERPDVLDKVNALVNHQEEFNISAKRRDFLSNILKYRNVSDKQISIIEQMHSEYFK